MGRRIGIDIRASARLYRHYQAQDLERERHIMLFRQQTSLLAIQLHYYTIQTLLKAIITK